MTNSNNYIIANWKMYGSIKDLKSIKKVIKISKKPNFRKTKIIYCPPFTLLNSFHELTNKTPLNVGAQNCHHNEFFGSYTGSISSNMIKSVGAKYVIIGHSENRKEGESNLIINKKIYSALSQKLKVIFCIGETLSEKKKKKTNIVLKKQINYGLKNIKNIDNIIFAYEPVWCIGTGIVPKTNDLRNNVIKIKKLIKNKFRSKDPIILYGGSVNPKNIVKFNKISEISGFLIGSASQNTNKFIDIIKKSII